MRETQLRSKMIKEILACGRPVRARSVHAGPHSGTVGEPDIDAVVDGVPLKIEVKLPGNRPTILQAAVIKQWAEVGVVAGWAHDMDGLHVLLDEAIARADRIREAGITW